MESNLPQYEAYKTLRNPILNNIPSHWIFTKLRYVTKILTDYTANGSFKSLAENVTYLDSPNYARLIRLTDLRTDLKNNNGVYVNEDSYRFLRKSSLHGGEFLIANVGAYSGLVVQMPDVDYRATLGPNMMMAKFDNSKVENKFMIYVANSEYVQSQFSLKANASSAQPKLNKEDFRNIYFAMPPLEEQSEISLFLNDKTSEIDSLIANKEKLIELLEEKRQAIITEAVTKGLNPDVKMKDSGVEWIGEIPEYWEVKKMKYLVSLRNHKVVDDEKLPYVGLENIESKTGKYKPIIDLEEVSVEGTSNIFYSGDVLFGKLRPYLAKCYVPYFDGKSTTELLVLNVNQNLISNEYLQFVLLSDRYIQIINSSTYGAKMPRTNWEFVSTLSVPLPDLRVQLEIVSSIKDKLQAVDELREKLKSQNEKLKEYRQSLIYEVVTGKIDIREHI
ncbi:EcoKI restriction-modification system protein HsdS [Oceanobacillus picturae]|uniref:EcoKI restriction-modification system protein HsdS n=1 Tax=Oceanobacillus picturae TaxID=171693 RepID=W9BDC8_9BACI|nr:restriction endonuclease subunit S [Oceanobacillus picturae]CDO04305.1 EcoKI restriction-modification system protein HsdS [Oceanobacillus picturae]